MTQAPKPASSESPLGGIGPGSIRVVQRRWRLMLGVAVLCAAFAVLWAARQPKVYEARITLQYEPGLGIATDGLVEGPDETDSSFRAQQELIRTQHYLLRSRSLAERVVRKLGLHEGTSSAEKPSATEAHAAFERAVAQVQASIEVIRVPATRLVTVAVRASSPEQAAKLANALADAYLEKSAEDRVSASSRALDWLRAEQTSLKQDVEVSELRVFKFREDHDSLSVSLEERRKALTDRHEAFGRAMTELRIRRVHAQARLTVLKDAIAAQPEPLLVQAGSVASAPAVLELREQYRNVEATLRALSTSPEPESAKISAAKVELAAIRAQLVLEIDALLKTAQADLKEVERTESGLQQAMAELHQQSTELSREELELARLERERASRTDRYRMVLERTAQADLAGALGANPVRIVDRAVPEAEPVSPRVAFAAALGGLAGLTLGILVALGWAVRRAGTLD